MDEKGSNLVVENSNENSSQKPSVQKQVVALFAIFVFICLIVGVDHFSHPAPRQVPNAVPTTAMLVTPTGTLRNKSPHLIVRVPSFNIASASAVIEDGDVYLIYRGRKERFVDKTANTHYYGDFDVKFFFTKAELSPDKSKMYLQAYGAASAATLFYIDLSRVSDSYDVGSSTHALWSPNSRYIAYTYGAGDCGPQNLRLDAFDTLTKETISLNDKTKIPNLSYDMFLYDAFTWLQDSSGLKVKYSAYKEGGCIGENILVGKGTTTVQINNK